MDNYTGMSDAEVIERYKEAYDIYVKAQHNRRELLHDKSHNDIASIRMFQELMADLCLENTSDGVILISMPVYMQNMSCIFSYICKQVRVQSMCISYNRGIITRNYINGFSEYTFAVTNAHEIGLGFDKYYFLRFDRLTMMNETSPAEVIDILNQINSNIRLLCNRYIAGFKTLKSVCLYERRLVNMVNGNKHLIARFGKCYDNSEEDVIYVARNVGEFKLV